jgi:hypothetical protein
MRSDEVEARLRELLATAGIDTAYRSDEDGEFHDQTQVHCTYLYTPTDALRALPEGGYDSFDVDLDTFFARILELPAFRLEDTPVALRLRQ